MHKRLDFKDADPAWDVLEAQWMQQLAAGGEGAEAALASLYRAYGALFVKRLRLWGLEVDEAQDVAQDLWIEVARAAPRWPTDVRVRFYLLGFLKTARKRYFWQRDQMLPVASLSDEAVVDSAEQALQALAPSSASETEWLDFVRCVRRALAGFGRDHPRLASLLMHRHVEELSLDEMAEVVGGTAERAKADVYAARRKFSPSLLHCLELWPNRQ